MEKPKIIVEQKSKLTELLTKDNRATVSPTELASALGEGINAESIRNAAFEGLLPYGWAHRGSLKGQRYVAIPKIAIWNWFKLGNL